MRGHDEKPGKRVGEVKSGNAILVGIVDVTMFGDGVPMRGSW